jgi:23S rRNA pseudouridine1911/1915/1917 synthase
MTAPICLFISNDFVVVHKPSGMVMDGTFSLSVKTWLEEHLRKQSFIPKWGPYPIHYIDRAVEGIVVFALKKRVFTQLQQQMEQGDFLKVYAARSINSPSINSFPSTINHFHSRTADGKRAIISEDDLPEYKTAALEILEIIPFIKIRLITGRFHQIRAQLAHLNAPIVGDTMYDGTDPPVAPAKIDLCAYQLSFTNPKTNERLEFSVNPSFLD